MADTGILPARLLTALGILLGGWPSGIPAQSAPRVLVTEVDGAIGVATARQIHRAVARARTEPAEALIIRMDTPGGLVTSTRQIIREMMGAPVPVVVYVAPSGAHAASAGTFIVYASHFAAMAPGTSLGAATPVQIGPVPGLPGRPASDTAPARPSERSAEEQKALNDAVALIRSLAQLRGRNPDFAERAVREAATLTVDEALQGRVIEFRAEDIPDLLAQLDGQRVRLAAGERVLRTRDAEVETLPLDWRTRLLAIITDPNIAFFLLMIGIYGVLLEFWHPGTFIPGTIGAICLILALIALAALPVNFGALALLLLGLGLMVAEAFTPGIGILGIGGLVAFVGGAIFLFEGAEADFRVGVSPPVIAGAALVTGGLIFGILGAAIRSRRQPKVSGTDELIGLRGVVVDWTGASGRVRVRGELWNARSATSLPPEGEVRVVGREGLTLIVES